MNSGKVILSIIGGWLLFIMFEVVSGRIARRGTAMLTHPLRLTYAVFGTARNIMLFAIAVVTFGLMVKHNSMTHGGCCSSTKKQEKQDE